MRGRGRLTAGLAALILIASCARLVPPGPEVPVGKPPAPPVPPTAALLGVHPGPAIASLPLAPAKASGALASFIESCPRLLARTDASGLTRQDDWRPACGAAGMWDRSDAARFFDSYFESAQIGPGSAFVTGYYEPEVAGVRTRRAGFDVPVYGLPTDLIRAWPEDTSPDKRTGRAPLGRYDESGKFVPYFTRAEIDAGALDGRVPVIAWAADPIELFFLEIQGSGRLRSPEGDVMRIGYAGQNGRDYVAVGGLLRQRGLLGTGPGQYPTSMQGIMQYLRDHPDDGRALMRENLSYVFFQDVPGEGPLGSLGVPVRPQSSVAADPNYTPLGAPVWLDLDRNEADGLWIAQDVGGAIKGPNRFDSFWGAGDQARTTAGGMTGRGQALVLLPKGTLARLSAR